MLAWKPRLAAVVTLMALVPAGEAVGQAPPGEENGPGFSCRGVTGQLGASVNNVGLQNTIAVVWTKPLSRSSHPLLAGASVSAGVVNVTTPTMTRTGGWVEYAPLSIFAVRAGVEPVGYFGTFSSLMPFDSYDDSYDEDVLFEKQGTKAGVGVRSYITPAIQFRAGPVAVRVFRRPLPRADARVRRGRKPEPAARRHRHPAVHDDALPAAEAQPDGGRLPVPG